MAAVQGTDPAPPASLGEHSPPDQLAVRHPRPPPPPPVDRAAVSAERRPPVDPSYGAPLALLISVLLEGAKRRGGGRSEQGSSRGTKIDQVKLRKLGAAFKKNGPVTAGNSSTISNGPVEELLAEALTSEGGCVELVRGKVQYPGKDYHTGTPGTSPRCKPKCECHNGRVDELPAKTLTSEGGDEKLARGKVKHPKKNYHTGTPRTSPRFEQKLRNGPVEELPAEALIFEGADSELMRGRAKHPRKDYHSGTPRTSPRFEPKRERRNGPVEELAANHKRFRTLEELIASPDTAESAKTPSTDSAN